MAWDAKASTQAARVGAVVGCAKIQRLPERAYRWANGFGLCTLGTHTKRRPHWPELRPGDRQPRRLHRQQVLDKTSDVVPPPPPPLPAKT